MSQRSRILLSVLAVWVASLALRLWGISDAPLFTDERLWINRAQRLLHRLHEDPISATTFLGHPGVPPTILMAVAQKSAALWNTTWGAASGEPFFLGLVNATRLPVALVSSLLAPLTILLLHRVAGLGVAATAGAALAFDPYLLACSRMAHLDAVMATLCLLTIYFYHCGTIRGDLRLKALAGLSWGLAVATKPTAVFLIPSFVAYRVMREALRRRGLPIAGEEGIVSWSDFGAVYLGHLLFALIYTRLWFHRSDYLTRLHVHNPLAGGEYALGIWLQQHSLLAITVCASLLVALLVSANRFRREKRRLHYHLACISAALLSLYLPVWLVPQVVENLIRFWTWAFGLSHEAARAFVTNVPIAVHPDGYLELALAHLPSAISLAAVGGCVAFLFRRYRLHISVEGTTLLTLLVTLLLFWFVFLGMADKQSWRYALPILVCVYWLAAFFLAQVVPAALRTPRAAPLLSTVLIATTLFAATQMGSYGFFFRSDLSGGLSAHIARGYGIEHFTSPKLTALLTDGQRTPGKPRRVMVYGDVPLQSLGIRKFSPQWRDNISFGGPGMKNPQRILTYAPAFSGLLSEKAGEILTVRVSGVALASVQVIGDKTAP